MITFGGESIENIDSHHHDALSALHASQTLPAHEEEQSELTDYRCRLTLNHSACLITSGVLTHNGHDRMPSEALNLIDRV